MSYNHRPIIELTNPEIKNLTATYSAIRTTLQNSWQRSKEILVVTDIISFFLFDNSITVHYDDEESFIQVGKDIDPSIFDDQYRQSDALYIRYFPTINIPYLNCTIDLEINGKEIGHFSEGEILWFKINTECPFDESSEINRKLETKLKTAAQKCNDIAGYAIAKYSDEKIGNMYKGKIDIFDENYKIMKDFILLRMLISELTSPMQINKIIMQLNTNIEIFFSHMIKSEPDKEKQLIIKKFKEEYFPQQLINCKPYFPYHKIKDETEQINQMIKALISLRSNRFPIHKKQMQAFKAEIDSLGKSSGDINPITIYSELLRQIKKEKKSNMIPKELYQYIENKQYEEIACVLKKLNDSSNMNGQIKEDKISKVIKIIGEFGNTPLNKIGDPKYFHNLLFYLEKKNLCKSIPRIVYNQLVSFVIQTLDGDKSSTIHSILLWDVRGRKFVGYAIANVADPKKRRIGYFEKRDSKPKFDPHRIGSATIHFLIPNSIKYTGKHELDDAFSPPKKKRKLNNGTIEKYTGTTNNMFSKYDGHSVSDEENEDEDFDLVGGYNAT